MSSLRIVPDEYPEGDGNTMSHQEACAVLKGLWDAPAEIAETEDNFFSCFPSHIRTALFVIARERIAREPNQERYDILSSQKITPRGVFTIATNTPRHDMYTCARYTQVQVSEDAGNGKMRQIAVFTLHVDEYTEPFEGLIDHRQSFHALGNSYGRHASWNKERLQQSLDGCKWAVEVILGWAGDLPLPSWDYDEWMMQKATADEIREQQVHILIEKYVTCEQTGKIDVRSLMRSYAFASAQLADYIASARRGRKMGKDGYHYFRGKAAVLSQLLIQLGYEAFVAQMDHIYLLSK